MRHLAHVTLRVAFAIVAMNALQGGLIASLDQGDATSFEAAAIKKNGADDARTRFDTSPGRLNATNVPLRFLIRQAYRVPESRILGGPAWLDTDRFDIVATVPTGATADA